VLTGEPRPSAGETSGLALSPALCAGFQRGRWSRPATGVGDESRVLESEALQRLVHFVHETAGPFQSHPAISRGRMQLAVDQSLSAKASLRPSARLRRLHAAEVLA
jgi:hypothetical protein